MNTIAAAVEIVKAIPSVYAIVGSRVYGSKIPKGGESNFPCIVIRRVGGESPTGREGSLIWSALVDIFCYAANLPDADTIAEAIRTRINGESSMRTTNYRLVAAVETSAPQDLIEQVTQTEAWDCVFVQYRLHIATN